MQRPKIENTRLILTEPTHKRYCMMRHPLQNTPKKAINLAFEILDILDNGTLAIGHLIE